VGVEGVAVRHFLVGLLRAQLEEAAAEAVARGRLVEEVLVLMVDFLQAMLPT
jgi:hypothetical protein